MIFAPLTGWRESNPVDCCWWRQLTAVAVPRWGFSSRYNRCWELQGAPVFQYCPWKLDCYFYARWTMPEFMLWKFVFPRVNMDSNSQENKLFENGLHALIVNLKKWRTRDDEGSQGSNHSQEFYGLLRVEVFYENLRALPSLIMFSMESFGTKDCTC